MDHGPVKVKVASNGHYFGWYYEDREVEAMYDGFSYLAFHTAMQCEFCGEHGSFDLIGATAKCRTACTELTGEDVVTYLQVPSGKMIVTDDLRPVYKIDRSVHESLNTRVGQRQLTLAMAEIGCAYGGVSNTSPSLYRTGPTTMVIASPDRSDETALYDDETDEFIGPGEKLADIVTDLWAYSIADFEDWKSRGGDPSTLHEVDTIVDVEPGTYRFTYHGGLRSFDSESFGLVVFTDIEKVA